MVSIIASSQSGPTELAALRLIKSAFAIKTRAVSAMLGHCSEGEGLDIFLDLRRFTGKSDWRNFCRRPVDAPFNEL
jgi:hypothetical protein